MVTVPGSLWREPRPAEVPPIGRADWLLVGGFAAAALVEGIVRPDLAWRPLVTVLSLALVPALLWRRGRPLVAALVGWGVAGLLAVVQVTAQVGDLGLYSMMAVLILLYSLVRWGSGREIVVGTSSVAVVVALGMYAAPAGWADAFGGTVLLLLVVALAAERSSATARTSGIASSARSAIRSGWRWRASCTTPWPTTSPPSRCRRRRVAWSPASSPRRLSRSWP